MTTIFVKRGQSQSFRDTTQRQWRSGHRAFQVWFGSALLYGTKLFDKLAAPVAERLRALLSLDHLTAGVGSSPALATCETSQALLAGVPGGFSRALPFSPHLPIGPSRMS